MKPCTSFISKSEKETAKIAEKILSSKKSSKNILCLFGDLGSGKTVFVKGIAKTLLIQEYTIKSPTYAFIREHKHNKGKLIHVDLYRLEEIDDLLFSQIEEFYSQKNTLVVIEWADRMKDKLPPNRTDICFEYIDENTRKITVF